MENMEKKSLIDVAYREIRDRILSFELTPGQAVSDFAIAKQLQMSRTPVREAIMMLRRDGLIEPSGKGGVVAPINEEEIKDLYIAREAVECKALDILIENGLITDEFIGKLRKYNQEVERYTDENNIHLTFEPDGRLHRLIVEETGSRRLTEQMGFYALQNDRLRFLTLISNGRAKLVPGEHEALIRALEQRSVKKAIEAMRWHLHYTTNEYIAAIKHWPANEWIPVVKAIEAGRTEKRNEG